jgi:uncharacterized protein (TIGR03435 family)
MRGASVIVRSALLRTGMVVFGCTAAFGQAAQDLTFDVASVKPAAPPQPQAGRGGVFFFGKIGGPGTADPERITWSNATLFNLLMTAYGVQGYQVIGPDWIKADRFDIVAKVPAEATKEQANVMWQNLLKERFGMTLHHESKEFPVDELVIAKGGPKLKETDLDPNAPPVPAPAGPPGPPKLDKNGVPELTSPGLTMFIRGGASGTVGHVVGKAQTMAQLATMLSTGTRPVVDKTGLTAKYDFTVEYTPDLGGARGAIRPDGLAGPGDAGAPADSASEPGSSLAVAVEKQLGLKLVGAKDKIDVIVIDHAEKTPTEN